MLLFILCSKTMTDSFQAGHLSNGFLWRWGIEAFNIDSIAFSVLFWGVGGVGSEMLMGEALVHMDGYQGAL